MPPKRDKRPSRLAWFAMDADAFLEDDRMQTLTNKEKGAWALMLIRSFRNKGVVITDPAIVAEQTGLSVKEAKLLIYKLLDNHIISPTDRPFQATSHRLQKEYEIALEAYQRYSQMGMTSAAKHGKNNLEIVR